jgi:retron-type reverse transcriptase
MRLLNLILKSTGKKGVPQGGVISPVLSNLYLDVPSVFCRRLKRSGNGSRVGRGSGKQRRES